MTTDAVRVVAIRCAICGFHNPDETARCFGCGAEVDDEAERQLVTVRRPRQRAEALRLVDLQALRARLAARTGEAWVRAPATRPVAARVAVATGT